MPPPPPHAGDARAMDAAAAAAAAAAGDPGAPEGLRPLNIALIECEDAAKWEGWTERLWKKSLGEPGDRWTLFRAHAGELPSADEAAAFDAMVVGGSHYSAYEDHPWIQRMLELLPQYAARGTRIYGCCFGHQVLARAFGGYVGRNPSAQFVLRIERVAATPQLRQLEQLHAIVREGLAAQATGGDAGQADADPCGGAPLCLRLLESHGDQVLRLPPSGVLLASSPSAEVELWSRGDNVLGSQFHIEFEGPLMMEKIWPTAKAEGLLDEEQAEASKASLEGGGQHSDILLKVIKRFMRYGLEGAKPCEAQGPPVASAAQGGGGGAMGAGSGSAGSSAGGPAGGPLPGDGGAGSGGSSQQQQQQQQPAPGGGAASATAAAAVLSLPPLRLPPSGRAAAAAGASGGASPAAAVGSPLPARLELLERHPSGASSPGGASERSAATASTSSAVPFSHIAHQRRQAARGAELADAGGRMVADAAAAFDLRMESYSLDLSGLQQLNAAAAEPYSEAAEIAAALAQFVQDLSARQAAAREALALLPQLDRQLVLLEAAVAQLAARSKALEARVCAGARPHSALDKLFGRGGAGTSAAATAAAAAGGALARG